MSDTITHSDIEAAYRAELDAATERNVSLCVQLAAMTLERDALRREVAALVGLCASDIDCGACPVDSSPTCMANPNECVKNIRDWAKQQAAQAGKGEG